MKAGGLNKNRVFQLEYQLMVIPGMIALIVFNYIPMYGILVGFKNYSSMDTFSSAPWVGLHNFYIAFKDVNFWVAVKNTVNISLIRILIGFPIPILFAILIFELRSGRFKKTTQTISYLPHFLSWVILGGMVISWLSTDGFVNNTLVFLHIIQKPIPYMIEPHYYYWISALSDIWKEAGWGTILYLAVMAGIDSTLFEAAEMDGATRLQKIRYITLPSIQSIIALTFVMTSSGLLGSNFDQAMVMQNPLNIQNSQVLSTYVYKMGISQGDFGYATAVDLGTSVISLLLLLIAYLVTKKINDIDIF